jgi:hypothetical protein
MVSGKCTNELALPLYGDRPSAGVCRVCAFYDGPPRPEPVKKNLVQKAVSYAKAEISQVVHGPVGVDQYEERIKICLACPRLKKATEEGKVGWCTACGCGEAKRAEMTIKAKMPQAKCPVNAWPKGDTPSR